MSELPILPTILIALLILTLLVAVYLAGKIKELTRKTRELSKKNISIYQREDELKNIAAKYQKEKDWYRNAFNNTHNMVFIHGITDENLPGQLIDVNNVMCTRLKYTHEQLLRMNPVDIEAFETPITFSGYSRSDLAVLPDQYMKDRARKFANRGVKQLMEQIIKNIDFDYERSFEDRNGEQIPVAISAHLIEFMGQQAVMCTAVDISDRKAAELALNESKQRARDFFVYSPIGIAIYDSQHNLVDVNQSCLKTFGIPDQEQFAKFNLFDNSFVPEDVKEQIKKGESVRYEAFIDFSDAAQSLFITNRTDSAYLNIMINNMGYDHDFNPKGYCAQIQDISDQREAEAELRENEKQLRQAERMEAIGSLAGGIAHDFNNILTPILGYAELTLRAASGDPVTEKCMKGIMKAGARAKDLVNQILTYCRKSDDAEEELSPTLVTPIIKEVLSQKRKAVPPEIEINRMFKAENDTVTANATKLHQVLMNICTNACHAMKDHEKGTLEIKTSNFIMDRRSLRKYPEFKQGQYLQISISDTGSGMSEETLSRIFEPFFTTKKKGEGTGMGLSVVQGIIKSLNGTITVESELDHGSVFHIILPTIKQQDIAENDTALESLDTGTERILLVDDESDVLEMITQMIESLGYKVTSSISGDAALKLFLNSQDEFDLIITDQAMPGITGMELASAVLKARPNMPIILTTGFPENLSQNQVEAAGVKQLMTKPLSLTDLAKVIRHNIDLRNNTL